MFKVNLSAFLAIICISFLGIMVVFSLGQLSILILSIIVLVCFTLMRVNDEITVLFFAVNLIAALNASILGVPLGSFLELVFIVKCLSNKANRIKANFFFPIVGIFAFSLIGSFALGYSYIRSIVYFVNLFMMVLLFEHSIEMDDDLKPYEMKKIFISFILSFALTLVVSLMRTDISSIKYYNRFTGLWTDPNFIGLFASISIAMIIILADRNIKKYLLSIPLILLFLYSGYLTFSRTFVIAIFVIIAFLMVEILRSNKIHLLLKILGIVCVIIAAYLIFDKYLLGIINARGILDYTGRDLTNGRIDDWHRAWKAFTADLLHLSFGSGSVTSHNTFFDVMLRYGPVAGILSIVLAINLSQYFNRCKMKRDLRLRAMANVLYVTLFIYLIALPMLDDDITYLLLGCMPLCLAPNVRNEETEPIQTFNNIDRM